MQFNRSSLAILVSASLAAGIAPNAFAQQENNGTTAAEKAKQKKAEEADIERIIVNGYEASLEAAEETKRNADTFVDSVSAAGLGEFVDDSVGDALNSVAGINIDTNDGIADGIYVGGLPPEYNQIQINGNTMGAGTNDSASFVTEGATTSGIFSTAVLSGLEVYKSARADKSEGSLGGTVNFKTWKPLNFKKPRFNIGLTTGYQEMDGEYDHKANILYGGRTDSEKFGWVIAASTDVKKGRIDTFSVSDQKLTLIDFDQNPFETDAVGELSKETAADSSYHFRTKQRESTRHNVVAAFQYQVTEDLVIGLEANYAVFQRFFHEMKNSYALKVKAANIGMEVDNLDLNGDGINDSYYDINPELATYRDLSSDTNQFVSRMLTSGVSYDGSHSFINFQRETEDEAKGLNFTADWIINDNFDMSLQATYSKNGFSWTPNNKAHQGFRRSGVDMLWLSGELADNEGYPEIYFIADDVQTKNEAGDLTINRDLYPNFDINNKATWGDIIVDTVPDYTQYTANNQSSETKDNSVETATLATDFSYYIEDSDFFNLVKFGFKYTNTQSDFLTLSTANSTLLPAGSYKGDFAMTDLGDLQETPMFLGGHNYQGVPLTWMNWDYDAFTDAIWDTGAGSWPGLGIKRGEIPAFTKLDVRHRTRLESLAVYAMATFDSDDWAGNFGVRYVYDDFYAYSYNMKPEVFEHGNQVLEYKDGLPPMIYQPGDAPEGSGSINYEAIAAWNDPANFYRVDAGREKGYALPSMNVRYTLADDLFLRFSAALTMSRQPTAKTRAKTSFGYSGDEESGDYFFKISGSNPELEPTFSRSYNLGVEWYLPKQGSVTLAFRHENLVNVRSTDTIIYPEGTFEAGEFVGYTGGEVRHKLPQNDGYGTVDSVEFGVRQKLKFLPGFLKHTGFKFNASYSDSDVIKPTETGFEELPRPAKVGFNAQYYYQHNKVTARLAYSWREARLTKQGNAARLGTQDDYRRNLNFSSSYKISKNFKVSFNVLNVLNSDPRRTSAYANTLVGETLTGREFVLSVNYNM